MDGGEGKSALVVRLSTSLSLREQELNKKSEGGKKRWKSGPG